ncbi:MAG: rhamnan synthesis F family protein, partial [Rhodospirillaceae bacterium]
LRAAQALAQRMGITIAKNKALDFPSGSMFWARSAALYPLLDLDLEFSDFDEEKDQIDGTLAHVIERTYFHICEGAGFKWLKMANPELFECTPGIITVSSPADLDKFINEHGLQLTGKNVPPPRGEHLPPVKPAQRLLTIIQEKSLGCDEAVNPETRVAVGVVTYNNPPDQLSRFLRSAENALKRSDLNACGHIYCVDNGKPSKVASGTAGKATTQLPSLGNVGFGRAHNRLMAEAFGNGADVYIAANPDGAFHPDAIAAMLQLMQAHGMRTLVEATQFPDEHPKAYDPFTFETDWASGACLAIPRKLYEKIGGFDESFFMYCEDVDYSWRARANGFAVRICPRALFLHAVTNRRHDDARRKMIFNAGVILGRKWGHSGFERWLSRELRDLGVKPTDVQPEPAPEDWRFIADFEHQFSFSETRW